MSTHTGSPDQNLDSASHEAAESSGSEPQAEILEAIVKRGRHQPFHTPDNARFVRVPRGAHNEVHEITTSGLYADLLQTAFHQLTGKFVNANVLSGFVRELRARAKYVGHCETVFVRVAQHPHENGFVLDLADESWRQVVVTATDWRVADEPVVAFSRTPSSRPLPTPTAGGSLEQLRQVINVHTETWPLVVAFLLGLLLPNGPYPLLLLVAQQGSGKSFAASVLKRLMDPTRAPLRALPRSEQDLMIAAQKSWLLCFDNVSSISPQFADALCRMATGGGFSARKLFSDEDEVVLEAKRPMLITGIEEVITRADLLDRTLMVHLQAIEPGHRKSEAELETAFTAMQPSLLGALLDAAVVGVRRRPQVRLDSLPRLADFALWVTACEPATGLPHGSILEAIERDQALRANVAMDADILVGPLKALVAEGADFKGSATELLIRLTATQPPAILTSKSWPRAANSLSNRLRRLMPLAPYMGLEMNVTTSQGLKTWTVRSM